MILGGVAVAAVLFVSGFFAYPMINESEFNIVNEQIGFGGYFTVEAYHSDGTLYQTWEGHNALTPLYEDAIIRCTNNLTFGNPLSGGRGAVSTLRGCVNLLGGIQVSLDNNQRPSSTSSSTFFPTGCDASPPQALCESWRIQATIDFDFLSCDPGVDCPNVIKFRTGINEIDPVPPIPVGPGDRLIVTIDFSFA